MVANTIDPGKQKKTSKGIIYYSGGNDLKHRYGITIPVPDSENI